MSGVIGTAWLNCQDLQSGGLSANPARSATRPPSHDAAVQAVVAWAQEHPDEWDASASADMANALAVTFLCEHELVPPIRL